MPKFHYTVVNQENQQLTGTINAPHIKNAREELNHLGLSVITIEEVHSNQDVTPKEYSDSENFTFEALDTTGRKILGRIKEHNKYKAYQRLRTEYNFDVLSLYKTQQTPEAQTVEKNAGIQELIKRFTQENQDINNIDADQATHEELTNRQTAISNKVELTIQKAEYFLTKFKGEIKPEDQKIISDQINKLKLLKNSTNLERVQSLCSEILTKIQERSIFMHQEQFLKEKTEIAIEAKKLIGEISKKSIKTPVSPTKPASNSIFQKIKDTIQEFLKEDPKITEIKEMIRATNTNLIEYIKLYFTASNQDERTEIKKRLSTLYNNRKALKARLHLTKQQLSLKLQKHQKNTSFEQFITFTGYLLSFYLVYYFISIYLTSKQIIFNHIPSGMSFYNTTIFKYLLPIVFIIYIGFRGISIFFPKNQFLRLISLPIIFFSSILIIFNF